MTDGKGDDRGDEKGEVVAFEQAKSPHEHARKEQRMASVRQRFRSATKQILATGRKLKRGKKGKGKGPRGGKGGRGR